MPLVTREARDILARTPRVLDAWLRGLDEAWLDADDGPGSWTPRQVVAHLIHGEKTDWIPRLRRVLDHGETVPFDPVDRSAHLGEERRPVEDMLDELTRLRSENLAVLDEALGAGLPLDRRGTHPELGAVNIGQLLATWTAHDLGHIVQIARTMARRYVEDVGPWARYLSVMAGDSRLNPEQPDGG